MQDISGKIAVITGGGRGMGRALRASRGGLSRRRLRRD